MDDQKAEMWQRRIPGITKGPGNTWEWERGSPPGGTRGPAGGRAKRSWAAAQGLDSQPGQGERSCVVGE